MSIILLISIGLGRYVFLQFVVGEEHDQEAMPSVQLDEIWQLAFHAHLIGEVGIENDQRALAQMLIDDLIYWCRQAIKYGINSRNTLEQDEC